MANKRIGDYFKRLDTNQSAQLSDILARYGAAHGRQYGKTAPKGPKMDALTEKLEPHVDTFRQAVVKDRIMTSA